MDQTIVAQYSLIAAAVIAAVAAIAAAFSDSKAASHALEGMTRQPEWQASFSPTCWLPSALSNLSRLLLSLSLWFSYSLTHSLNNIIQY